MKQSAFFRAAFCMASSIFLICAASAPAQLVNGGFENGNFTGWTISDPSMFTLIGSDPAFAHSGMFYANLGASGLLGSLSQTFNTVIGSSYTLSFALANDGGLPPNQFDISWGGTLLSSVVNAPTSPYAVFTFDNLVANGPTTTLEFRYRNDKDFFRLDDVSVSIVPEASTTSFTLLGLGLVSFLSYRKTRARRLAAAV